MGFSSYKDFLLESYPSTAGHLKKAAGESAWGGASAAPSKPVSLSPPAINGMEKTVQALFQLKRKRDYLDFLFRENSPPAAAAGMGERPQDSVLMGYDFHIDSQGLPRLIEVNTNASGFLIVNSLRQFQGLPFQKALDSLKKSFQREWEKFQAEKKGKILAEPKKICLIDEKPLEQKMALEFFMYKDFFESMGWDFALCDSASLRRDQRGRLLTERGEEADFIYNRCTDFYFERHSDLARAFRKKPHASAPIPLNIIFCLTKKGFVIGIAIRIDGPFWNR